MQRMALFQKENGRNAHHGQENAKHAKHRPDHIFRFAGIEESRKNNIEKNYQNQFPKIAMAAQVVFQIKGNVGFYHAVTLLI
jgi:hypothetical protein